MGQSPMDWEGFFAKNLRTERSRLGITQQDLASKLGMKSGATVTQWEKSTSFPNLETFVRICNFFLKTPTQMLYEDLTSFSPPKLNKLSDGDSEGTNSGGRGQPTASVLASESPPPQGQEARVMEAERKLIDLMVEIRDLRGG